MDDWQDYLTVRAGVLVPLAQAGATGFLVSLLTGAVAGFFGLSKPVILALACGAVVTLGAWLWLLAEWRAALYGVAESQVSEPVMMAAETIRVELTSSDGTSGQYLDLPATRAQLESLAVGLVRGQSFTEATWTGAGRPFSRSGFVRLRDELLSRGLAVWVSDHANARGVRVTQRGMALFRHVARLADSTTPLKRR